VSPIVGAALVGDDLALAFDGPEPELLAALDRALATLPPGVLVTWNGSAFDLPYLADRARRVGATLGLVIRHDEGIVLSREPLRGHPGAYRGQWYDHRHLDGYRLYRAEIDPESGLSCGLKSLARHFGLEAIEVDRTRIHELDADALRRYVLRDAVLARELVARRFATARHAIDPPARTSAA
jgi:DNA polymerase elongation subunit (family B)